MNFSWKCGEAIIPWEENVPVCSSPAGGGGGRCWLEQCHEVIDNSFTEDCLGSESENVSHSAVPNSAIHRLYPTRLLCPWNSPGKNTGVGCRSLLQGIVPTQGSNLGLSHCRQILHHLSHQGSPRNLIKWVDYRTSVLCLGVLFTHMESSVQHWLEITFTLSCPPNLPSGVRRARNNLTSSKKELLTHTQSPKLAIEETHFNTNNLGNYAYGGAESVWKIYVPSAHLLWT